MTLTSTDEKKTKIKNLLSSILHSPNLSLRHLVSLIGNTVASFSVVIHGSLYCRHLERDKKQDGLSYGKFREGTYTICQWKRRATLSIKFYLNLRQIL